MEAPMETEASMEIEPALRARIDALLADNRVVLFMKGVRGAPQCGFSATVCRILDTALPEYHTLNVLADPELRDGIKHYSNWPTIPQLYVAGEFIGGCDIIQEMASDGSLFETLGVAMPTASDASIRITEAAAGALRALFEQQPEGNVLHLRIDARFQNQFFFGPGEAGEQRLEAQGVELWLDPLTLSRADGLVIDAVENTEGAGFRIDNPNAPPAAAAAAAAVKTLTPRELKQWLDAGRAFELFDVREPSERAIAHIEGARLLDERTAAALEARDRNTALVFHCHHGGRSRAAAEHFASLGFRNVWNLEGGIDAWSREVAPTVPRY